MNLLVSCIHIRECHIGSVQKLLRPNLIWFANCLELYHFFFIKQDVLELTINVDNTKRAGETDTAEDNVLNILENMLQYTFQQCFHPIVMVSQCHCIFYTLHCIRAQVLYKLLPCMLEECLKDPDQIEGKMKCPASQAVDFLKGVLELILDLNIHTEVCLYF